MRDQYDLIGFDPRGVGGSSPLTCGLNDSEQGIDRPYRPESFGSDVVWARTITCRSTPPGHGPHGTAGAPGSPVKPLPIPAAPGRF
ncbi:hypothetical protein OTB20_11250 [Streptomyces sp. H27-H1]|uniref:hypothetical protein n=1 Tax=Streptomyces sp. H27-H1 TaxID=2996461 RepID=UPI002270EBF5|nr:hypothetical protein [Streptomyces sp. H27-H1]MCY0926770.1 hypothetical protein [Streptomyces sp. H27-H1]